MNPSYISVSSSKAITKNNRVVISLAGTALFSNAGSLSVQGLLVPVEIRPAFTIGFSGRGYYADGIRIVPFSGTLTKDGTMTFETTEKVNVYYQVSITYDI